MDTVTAVFRLYNLTRAVDGDMLAGARVSTCTSTGGGITLSLLAILDAVFALRGKLCTDPHVPGRLIVKGPQMNGNCADAFPAGSLCE